MRGESVNRGPVIENDPDGSKVKGKENFCVAAV